MAKNKAFLEGPTPQDHAKESMFQGGVIFAIGALLILGSWYFLGVTWGITVVIAVVGLFRFLYGAFYWLTGWE